MLSEDHFGNWLDAYGKAWRARDARAFGGLFADDALYYETPFEAPKKGRETIAAAFAANVAGQRDVDFGARVLYVEAMLGAAHWSCAFTRARGGRRVHADGVLVVQFDASGRALSYRQWRHTDER